MGAHWRALFRLFLKSLFSSLGCYYLMVENHISITLSLPSWSNVLSCPHASVTPAVRYALSGWITCSASDSNSSMPGISKRSYAQLQKKVYTLFSDEYILKIGLVGLFFIYTRFILRELTYILSTHLKTKWILSFGVWCILVYKMVIRKGINMGWKCQKWWKCYYRGRFQDPLVSRSKFAPHR